MVCGLLAWLVFRPGQEPVQTGKRILPHLLRGFIVGVGGKVMLQPVVGIGFMGQAPASHLAAQLDALVKGNQLVVATVEQTRRRQAFQVISHAVLLVWVTIDNTALLCLAESHSRQTHNNASSSAGWSTGKGPKP
jgi:hypothetical protein